MEERGGEGKQDVASKHKTTPSPTIPFAPVDSNLCKTIGIATLGFLSRDTSFLCSN